MYLFSTALPESRHIRIWYGMTLSGEDLCSEDIATLVALSSESQKVADPSDYRCWIDDREYMSRKHVSHQISTFLIFSYEDSDLDVVYTFHVILGHAKLVVCRLK